MLVLAALVVLLSASIWPRANDADVLRALDAAALPASPTPALRIGRPVPLPPARRLAQWSAVRVPTVARAEADRTAPIVTRLATKTPEGTANLVTVLGTKADSSGRLWVRVRLPVLPNGTAGWVPRRALGAYVSVRTNLVVDRKRLRATLYRDGKKVFEAPVGIGTAAWPTPAGVFIVRNKLTQYRSPFYGPIAFGTTARSAVLTDWPAGGFVGIHGTNAPQLVPGRVSHGCIRVRNADIVRLARLMPVGTPLTIL